MWMALVAVLVFVKMSSLYTNINIYICSNLIYFNLYTLFYHVLQSTSMPERLK